MAIMFWDEVEPGVQCAVPCWPVDSDGNDLDCPGSAMLTGVMDEKKMFQAEDAESFDPAHMTWVCANCRESMAA